MSINQIILDHITNEEVENKVVKGLNKAIDIPFINENQKKRLLVLYGR